MKKIDTKGKKITSDKSKARPQTSPLKTEERLTVIANLIIDRLMEKYGDRLANVNKSV